MIPAMAPSHRMRLDERLHDNGWRNDTVALLPHATRTMAARDEDWGGCDWRITVHRATSPPLFAATVLFCISKG
ncbi:epoxide hydrolase [Sesbania bispinosa]|nr:epoxide hydrolase [Sesbania bispinosa]